MTDHTDLAGNTVRAKINADVQAKLDRWFDNPEDAYDLEAVREMHSKAL